MASAWLREEQADLAVDEISQPLRQRRRATIHRR
jgi:hypothetical protein